MRMGEIETYDYARQLLERMVTRQLSRPRKRLVPSKRKATTRKPKPGGTSKRRCC